MRRAVFSILVGNSSGVLSRVAGMFSRCLLYTSDAADD